MNCDEIPFLPEAGHHAAWKLAGGSAEVSFTPESSAITSEQWAQNRNCKFSSFLFCSGGLSRRGDGAGGSAFW